MNLVSFTGDVRALKKTVKRGVVQILGLSLQEREGSWSSNPGFEVGYEQMATGRLRCSHQIHFH